MCCEQHRHRQSARASAAAVLSCGLVRSLGGWTFCAAPARHANDAAGSFVFAWGSWTSGLKTMTPSGEAALQEVPGTCMIVGKYDVIVHG